MNINIKNAMFYLLNELFKFKKKEIFCNWWFRFNRITIVYFIIKLKAKVFNLDIVSKLKNKKINFIEFDISNTSALEKKLKYLFKNMEPLMF